MAEKFAVRAEVDLAFKASGVGPIATEFQKVIQRIQSEASKVGPKVTAERVQTAKARFEENVVAKTGAGTGQLRPEFATKLQNEVAQLWRVFFAKLTPAAIQAVTRAVPATATTAAREAGNIRARAERDRRSGELARARTRAETTGEAPDVARRMLEVEKEAAVSDAKREKAKAEREANEKALKAQWTPREQEAEAVLQQRQRQQGTGRKRAADIDNIAATVEDTKATRESTRKKKTKVAAETESVAATVEEAKTTRRKTSTVKQSTQERRNQDERGRQLLTPTGGAAEAVPPAVNQNLVQAKGAAAEALEQEAVVTSEVVSAERRLLDAKNRAALALQKEEGATEAVAARAEAAAVAGGAPRAGRPQPGQVGGKKKEKETEAEELLRLQAARRNRVRLTRQEQNDPTLQGYALERRHLARKFSLLDKEAQLSEHGLKLLREIALANAKIAEHRRRVAERERNLPENRAYARGRAATVATEDVGNKPLQKSNVLLASARLEDAAESRRRRATSTRYLAAEEEDIRTRAAETARRKALVGKYQPGGPGQGDGQGGGVLGGFGRLQQAFQGPGLMQLLGRRAITTASFAATGMSFRSAIQGLSSMISQAEELQRTFSLIRVQFRGMDREADFPRFRESMLEIARTTGISATQVARVGFQIAGVFKGDTQRAIRETSAAMRAALVTGLPQAEIVDSLTAASLAFGVSIDTITDKAVGLEERFGVLSAESIKFFGDISNTAKITGLSLDELGATLGILQQRLGVSGGALSEQFGRLLGSVTDNLPQIVEIFTRYQGLAQGGGLARLQEAIPRGSGAALFELARGWDQLSASQQQAVARQLGGTRQFQTTLTALSGLNEEIQNGRVYWDDSGKAVEREAELQKTFGQQLQRTREALRQVGDALAQSGLATFTSELLFAFRGLVDILRNLMGITGSWGGRVAGILVSLVAMRVVLLSMSTLVRAYSAAGVTGAFRAAGAKPVEAAGGVGGGFLGGGRGFFGLRGALGGDPRQRRGWGQRVSGMWFGRAAPAGPAVAGAIPYGDEPPWDTPVAGTTAPIKEGPPPSSKGWQGQRAVIVAEAQATRDKAQTKAGWVGVRARRVKALVSDARARAAADRGTAAIEAESAAGAAGTGAGGAAGAARRAGMASKLGGVVAGVLGSPFFFVATTVATVALASMGQRREKAREEYDSALQVLTQDLDALDSKDREGAESKIAEIRALAGKEDESWQRTLQKFGWGRSKAEAARQAISQAGRVEEAPRLRNQLKALGEVGALFLQDKFDNKKAMDKFFADLSAGDEDATDKANEIITDVLDDLRAGNQVKREQYEVVYQRLEKMGQADKTVQRAQHSIDLLQRQMDVGFITRQAYVTQVKQQNQSLWETIAAYKRQGQTPDDSLVQAAFDTQRAIQDADQAIRDANLDVANAAVDRLKAMTRDPVKIARYAQKQAQNTVRKAEADVTAAKAAVLTGYNQAISDAFEKQRQEDIGAAQKVLDAAQKAFEPWRVSYEEGKPLRSSATQLFDKGQYASLEEFNYYKGMRDTAAATVQGIKDRQAPAASNLANAAALYQEAVKASGGEETAPVLAARAALDQALAVKAQADFDLVQAESQKEDARIRLRRVREGGAKNVLKQAQRAKEDAQLALKRAKEQDLGLAAELNAQADIIEADRAIDDAMFAIGQSRIRLFQAVATAAGRDTEAAQKSVDMIRAEIARQMKVDPTDKLALNELRTQETQAVAQRQATYVSERREIIDFQREMGEITIGQAIAQLQALLASPEVQANEDRIREIKLAIRGLQKETSGLQFNIGELRLPTLYEARRLNATSAMGQGYNDNRQVMVYITVNNNGDLDQAVQAFSDAASAPSRYGTEPRFNFSRN